MKNLNSCEKNMNNKKGCIGHTLKDYEHDSSKWDPILVTWRFPSGKTSLLLILLASLAENDFKFSN